MRISRFVLVPLCIGLLGAIAIIASLPKPAAPDTRQVAALSRSNNDNWRLRPQIGAPLVEAQKLAEAGKYKEALAVVDGLKEVPNKRPREVDVIGRMRLALLAGVEGRLDSQAR